MLILTEEQRNAFLSQLDDATNALPAPAWTRHDTAALQAYELGIEDTLRIAKELLEAPCSQ